jgi:hypothetical protein
MHSQRLASFEARELPPKERKWVAKVALGKEQAMPLAQCKSGSQKPHTSGYIRDTGFG